MKHEKFYYSSANVPLLKRKIRWNFMFALLMIAIILLELYLIMYSYDLHIKLSLIENIVGIITMVFALSFVLIQIANISKSMAIIKKIKKEGHFETETLSMDFNKKTSFGNVFLLVEYIIFLITIIAVAGFVTYAVLKYIYSSQLNYYVPILLSTIITTHYSCKNIEFMYMLKKG